MYKMVAVDLDDTLLGDNNQISCDNRRALTDVLEKGITVCLVSGRSYSSTKKYLELLGLRHLTGSLNGACVIDPQSDKLMYSLNIEKSLGCEIVKRAEAYGIHVNFYHGHRVVCREENEFSKRYMHLTGAEIEYVGLLSEYAVAAEAGKLLLNAEIEMLEKTRQELLECYGDKVNITFSKPDFLEIYDKAASKEQAVRRIAEYYGFSADEIIAIGDGENDISMLQYAGVGIAMGNASAKVKENADFVTLSNNDSGVAYALERFGLIDGGFENGCR